MRQPLRDEQGADDDHGGAGEPAYDAGGRRTRMQDGAGQQAEAGIEDGAGQQESQPEDADLEGEGPVRVRVGELRSRARKISNPLGFSPLTPTPPQRVFQNELDPAPMSLLGVDGCRTVIAPCPIR